MDTIKATPFKRIYDAFFTKVTDDMYLEFTREDTEKDLCSILLNAIPRFEFPRFRLYDYTINEIAPLDGEDAPTQQIGTYNCELTMEEINILASLMMSEWFTRQVATIDNTRMKYSSTDFKFTSQANHLDKLVKAKAATDTDCKRMQRMYKRRRTDEQGYIMPNYSGFRGGMVNDN